MLIHEHISLTDPDRSLKEANYSDKTLALIVPHQTSGPLQVDLLLVGRMLNKSHHSI